MSEQRRSYGEDFADEAKPCGALNGDAHWRTMPKHRSLPLQA